LRGPGNTFRTGRFIGAGCRRGWVMVICPAVNIAAVVAGYRRRCLPIGNAVHETGEEDGLGRRRQEATTLGGGNLVARAERIGFGSVHYF
jgi:hypothetical protein